ncbi:hypothetical protein Pint_34844 [Pistacia integerrima]|uniref:Uncharacterized protein n=1 Tax=Pistacia integerrima TaxID=434235 RepID=A0ACC0X5J3_9ROSI|nr:hypothetical protein Pint_34844 [Pistacia integerrima]
MNKGGGSGPTVEAAAAALARKQKTLIQRVEIDIANIQDNSLHQYRVMFHALSTVLRKEGPRALYKARLPSIIGVLNYWPNNRLPSSGHLSKNADGGMEEARPL